MTEQAAFEALSVSARPVQGWSLLVATSELRLGENSLICGRLSIPIHPEKITKGWVRKGGPDLRCFKIAFSFFWQLEINKMATM